MSKKRRKKSKQPRVAFCGMNDERWNGINLHPLLAYFQHFLSNERRLERYRFVGISSESMRNEKLKIHNEIFRRSWCWCWLMPFPTQIRNWNISLKIIRDETKMNYLFVCKIYFCVLRDNSLEVVHWLLIIVHESLLTPSKTQSVLENAK